MVRMTGVEDSTHYSGTAARLVLFIASLLLQVMLVIDAAVSHLEDLSSLEEYLYNLGKKHQAVGVKVESFSVRHPLLSYYSCSCSPVCSLRLSPSPCAHPLGSAG